MSVSSLIERHHAITEQLITAIKNDDEDAIRAADKFLSWNLTQILAVEPVDGASKLILLDFFLDMLKPKSERSSIDKQICNRLLSICENTAGVDLANT